MKKILISTFVLAMSGSQLVSANEAPPTREEVLDTMQQGIVETYTEEQVEQWLSDLEYHQSQNNLQKHGDWVDPNYAPQEFGDYSRGHHLMIREYLATNPRATTEEIEAATGASPEEITDYQKQEQQDRSPEDNDRNSDSFVAVAKVDFKDLNSYSTFKRKESEAPELVLNKEKSEIAIDDTVYDAELNYMDDKTIEVLNYHQNGLKKITTSTEVIVKDSKGQLEEYTGKHFYLYRLDDEVYLATYNFLVDEDQENRVYLEYRLDTSESSLHE